MSDEQVEMLTPETRESLGAELDTLRLDQLSYAHKHGEPSAQLRRSVKKWGILTAITVFEMGQDGLYWVYDGGRRCKAAKATGVEVVSRSDPLCR